MGSSTRSFDVGDAHSAVVVDGLTRTQIVQYAGASGDFNPIHTDEVFATQVAGYPSVFDHGMLTMGMTGRMLTDLVGDGRLPHPGSETIVETYYAAALRTFLHLTLDYQFVDHPAYNRDRGPVSIFAVRLHVQF